MKKSVFVLMFMLVSLCAFAEKQISVNELPADAKSFLNTHFTNVAIATVEKDFENLSIEYEVKLVDGTEIDFDSKGVWKSISVLDGKAIPSEIIPKCVSNYLKSKGKNQQVEELSRERRGYYEVELSNGEELHIKV